MLLNNAIKKLGKLAKINQTGRRFWAQIGARIIEFVANGNPEENPNITCIRVRSANDNDDVMSDYSAGVWCSNLEQAIRLAK